jgi:hypothetical protein
MSNLIGRRASLAVGVIAISAQFGVPSASAQSATSLEPRPRTGLSVPPPVPPALRTPARDWPPPATPPTPPNISARAYSEKVAQLDGGCLWYIVTDTFYRDGRSDSQHTKTAQPCDQPAPEVPDARKSEDKAADNSPDKTDEDNPGQGKSEAAQSGQDEKKVESEPYTQPPPKVERRSGAANPLANAHSLHPAQRAPAPSRITALRRGTSHSKTFAHALQAPPEGAPAYSGELSIAGLEGLAGMGMSGFAVLGSMRAHRFGGFFRP